MAAVAHASGSGELVPLRESASSAAAAAALAAMQTGSVSPAVFLNAKAALMTWSSQCGGQSYWCAECSIYIPSDDSRVSATRARENGRNAASIATATERSVSVMPNSRREECVGKRP